MINLEVLNLIIFFLKVLIVILSLIFLFGVIYFLLKTEWFERRFLLDLTEFFSFKPYGLPDVSKKWKKIVKRLEQGTESEAKLAIIEADDLLNETLEKMGYSGESLEEKLKQLKRTILPNLDEVFEIQKIKSDIVHDPSFQLSFDQAKRILEIYERALSNLEAL
jgi:hypothetical protein